MRKEQRNHEDEPLKEKSRLQTTARIFREVASISDSPHYYYQREAYLATSRALFEGKKKILIVLPTGSGKSHMQSEVAVAAVELGLNVIIVTSRRSLVDDIFSRVTKKAVNLVGFEDDVAVRILSGKKKRFDRPVTVMTYPAFLSAVRDGSIDPTKFDLLSLDEVQNATSNFQVEIQDAFVEAETAVVGWTATPQMSFGSVDDFGFNREYERTILEAIYEGDIAPIRITHVKIDKSNLDLTDIPLRKDGDFDEQLMGKKIDISVVNRAVKKIWEENCQGVPTLIFTLTRHHARAIAEEINNSFPGKAASIDGSTPRKRQKEIEKLLIDSNSELGVVVNAEVWGEGTDLPPIKRIILVNAFLSPMGLIQKIGRGFRKFDDQELQVFEFHYDEVNSISMVDVLEGNVAVCSKERSQTPIDLPKIPVIPHFGKLPDGVQVATTIEEMLSIGTYGIADHQTRLETVYEGWKTVRGLAAQTGMTPETIRKFIFSIGDLSENDVKSFRILVSGRLEFRDHFSPRIAEKVLNKYKTNIEEGQPPEAWLNAWTIRTRFKLSEPLVNKLLTELVEKNPHSRRFYKDKSNTPRAYYAPELIEELLLKVPKKPPEGWVRSAVIFNEMRKKFEDEDLEQLISSTLLLYPEDAQEFQSGDRKLYSFYSPRLVEIFIGLEGKKNNKKDRDLSQIPQGWLSVRGMMRMTGQYREKITTRLSKISIEADEKMQIETAAGTYTYYSPVIVEKVISDLEKTEPNPVPPGWKSKWAIANEVGRTVDFVESLIEKHKGNFNDSVRRILVERGEYDYYSPELIGFVVKAIAQKESEIEEVPPGWKTKKTIAKELGRSTDLIERLILESATLFENSSRIIKRLRGSYVYYSPELIEYISRQIN